MGKRKPKDTDTAPAPLKPGDKVTAVDMPELEGATLEVLLVVTGTGDAEDHAQVHAPDQGHGVVWLPVSKLQLVAGDDEDEDDTAGGEGGDTNGGQ